MQKHSEFITFSLSHFIRYHHGSPWITMALLRLNVYKPVSDWLRMYFLLDIDEMKRNDLCLNVKGNYVLSVGKILLNLY